MTSAEVVKVWDLTVGVLGEVTSHFSLTKKPGRVYVGRMGYDLIDGPVNELMRGFIVADTSCCLC